MINLIINLKTIPRLTFTRLKQVLLHKILWRQAFIQDRINLKISRLFLDLDKCEISGFIGIEQHIHLMLPVLMIVFFDFGHWSRHFS